MLLLECNSDVLYRYQVSSKYEPAFLDASTRDVSTLSATVDRVVEPVIVQSTKQSPSFFLPSELLLVDDAVQDIGSGMLTDQVYKSVDIKSNYFDTAIIAS